MSAIGTPKVSNKVISSTGLHDTNDKRECDKVKVGKKHMQASRQIDKQTRKENVSLMTFMCNASNKHNTDYLPSMDCLIGFNAVMQSVLSRNSRHCQRY